MRHWLQQFCFFLQAPPEYSEVIKQPGLYGPGPQNPTLQYQPTGGVSYPCYIYHAQDGGQVHSPVAVVYVEL